jgi:hypothetical protein
MFKQIRKKIRRHLPWPFRKKTLGDKLGISLEAAPDLFVKILLVVGVIFIWRGIWNFMDTYFLPENFVVSNIIGIVIGLALIYLPDDDFDELV